MLYDIMGVSRVRPEITFFNVPSVSRIRYNPTNPSASQEKKGHTFYIARMRHRSFRMRREEVNWLTPQKFHFYYYYQFILAYIVKFR